jgi:hypothetical protein
MDWKPSPHPAPIGEICASCKNNKSNGAVYELAAPNLHWRFYYHSCISCTTDPKAQIDGKSRIFVHYSNN